LTRKNFAVAANHHGEEDLMNGNLEAIAQHHFIIRVTRAV
jgi:hypothetical protein